jgi:hypothetical protein
MKTTPLTPKTIKATSYLCWNSRNRPYQITIAIYRRDKKAFVVHREFVQYFACTKTVEAWNGKGEKRVVVKLAWKA